MVIDYGLRYIGLHVSESRRCVGKGPRCQASGLTPSELIARFHERLDRAVKEADPECRIITHADDFLPWQHTARRGMGEAASLLPRDTMLSCRHYNAGDSVAYAVKTARLCEKEGLSFFLVLMYDLPEHPRFRRCSQVVSRTGNRLPRPVGLVVSAGPLRETQGAGT